MKVINITKELLFLLLFVGFPGISYSFTVETQHPRIFISPNNIETLKARSGTANPTNPEYQSHAIEYGRVRDAADTYSIAQIEGFDGLNQARMGLANAFVYMMEYQGNTSSSYYLKGKVLLDQISSLGTDDKSHYAFMTACMIYDWYYNDLSTTDRNTYVNNIVQYVTTSSWYSSYNSFDPYYHDRKYPTSLFALSGQAIFNEDAVNGHEFIRRSIAVYNRMMPVQIEISEDGFIYPIGQDGYFDESGWQPVLRILAGLKFAGVTGPEIDLIEYASISKTAYGEIYSLVKDNFMISHNDGYNERNGDDKPWRYSRGPEGPFYSAILAKLHQGEEIGRITNYLQSKYVSGHVSEHPFTYLGSILFNNKSANEVTNTISNLPLTKVFDDTVLVYRSGWDGLTSENTEVVFNFMAEKHVNGHTKFAKGHFDIWRGYDPLTFPSGDYSNTSYEQYVYYQDSLSANTMLIRHPTEDTGAAPNDGGQLTNFGLGGTIGMHNSSAWRTLGHTDEGGITYTGRIKSASFGDDYFYTYYHYPSAYYSQKLNDISRSVARLGDYFIVLDRIDGVNASYEKKWLLHSVGTPTIMDSGAWNGGTAPDGNGGTPNQTSSNTKLLKITEGNSSLFVKSIYPTNTIIHRVGGSFDYRWYSYNENFNYSQGGATHGGYGDWRLEIESSMGTEDDVFLTLLHPTSTTGTMAPTSNLSGTNYVGVQIDAGATTKVAIFSNSVNEATKQISYSFQVNSTQPTQILAGDLSTGTYNISRNGSLAETASVTDEAGSLFFEVASGGNLLIERTGNIKKPKSPVINQ